MIFVLFFCSPADAGGLRPRHDDDEGALGFARRPVRCRGPDAEGAGAHEPTAGLSVERQVRVYVRRQRLEPKLDLTPS